MKNIHISYHAIERYNERIFKGDLINKFRRNIITRRLQKIQDSTKYVLGANNNFDIEIHESHFLGLGF